MADAFQLQLRLHTPVILPTVVPRLDTLLTEATRRLHLDWDALVETLPLSFDSQQGGYRASQLIFGVTRWQGIEAHTIKYSSDVKALPLQQMNKGKRVIKMDGGGTAPKLTRHTAHLSPYLLLYGEGDGQQCAELLSLLGGIGLEHARGQGFFTVESIKKDPTNRWQLRPWRTGEMHKNRDYTAIPDVLSMTSGGKSEPVYRPPRMLKEVLQ